MADTAQASAQRPNLGPLVRARRRAMSLTLQELSDMSGVSVSYISQIERDHVTPTLGTLTQLAKALGLGLDYFVAVPKVSDSLVRRKDRRRFSLDGVSQQYEQVGAELPNHELSAFVIYVPAGYASETVSHEGEEFVYVLSGQVNMTLDGEALVISAGDCLHYRGNRRHSWSNRSDETAELLWVGRLTFGPLTNLRRSELPLSAVAPITSKGAAPGQQTEDPPTGDEP